MQQNVGDTDHGLLHGPRGRHPDTTAHSPHTTSIGDASSAAILAERKNAGDTDWDEIDGLTSSVVLLGFRPSSITAGQVLPVPTLLYAQDCAKPAAAEEASYKATVEMVEKMVNLTLESAAALERVQVGLVDACLFLLALTPLGPPTCVQRMLRQFYLALIKLGANPDDNEDDTSPQDAPTLLQKRMQTLLAPIKEKGTP
eukprot:1157437-Pelagomonas_calceolata.AAC.19